MYRSCEIKLSEKKIQTAIQSSRLIYQRFLGENIVEEHFLFSVLATEYQALVGFLGQLTGGF
jgi:hypothetical protein